MARITSLSLLGTFQFALNGNEVGPSYSLTSGGAPAMIEMILPIEKDDLPATIQVTVSGLTITLAEGTTATLVIERLSD